MTARLEYELVTARGKVIKTFDDRRAATAHANKVSEVFPDCEVFEVEYLAPVRRRIWRDRIRLVKS